MRTDRHYFKVQSKFVRRPARIRATRCDEVIGVGVYPEYAASEPMPDEATIFLTPHEAQGFAAWLSQQAEHLLAKQARAAARKAARRAAREATS